MVTDKAEEQTALHFACIILFLYLRIRACFLSRRSAASPSVPPVDAQQSVRPATVTEVTAKSLIFVLTQRHLNVFLLLNLQYWHANEPRENSLEEMCRLCYDQMAMGDIHCHSFAFLYSHHCGEFLTVSPGGKKKRERERKKMHSALPIDHTSNGCRSCVANASDQTRRKKTGEQKARLTARVSRHNK